MCKIHCQRKWKWGDPTFNKYEQTLRERLFSRVRSGAPDECWLWLGNKNRHGYGYLKFRTVSIGAHRASWEVHCGAIPAGLSVLHRCDNPTCCNPNHLFLGTQADNMADMIAKGRRGERAMPFGENHPHAKLSSNQVADIRRRLAAGAVGLRLAREYGVSDTTIIYIKNGKSRRKG